MGLKAGLLRLMALCCLLLCQNIFARGKEEKFLSMVPGRVVTLEAVVGLGFQYSDQAQSLKADLAARNVPILRAHQQLAGQVSANISQSSDKSQPIGPFSYQTNSAQNLSLEWSQAFRTGTQFSTSFSSTQTDLEFSTPGAVSPPEFQSKFSLSVTQSLYKNAFGSATRKSLEAANLMSRGIESQYQEQLGQWFLQVEQIYRQAWLAQKSVQYARERIITQKRLLKVIRLSSKRGTADQADVLNVEQNLIRVEQAHLQAKKSLSDIWRQLVIILKLPIEFMDMNPEKIPLKKSITSKDFSKICSKSGLQRALNNQRVRFASVIKNLEAMKLNLDVRQDALRPNIYLQASAGSNGVNDELGQTAQDSFSMENPNYALVLGVQVPLGQGGLEADAMTTKKDYQKLKLLLSSKKGEVHALWANTCEQVRRLEGDEKLFRKMIKLNKKRNKMEESRFSLGKVDVQAVILSANDIILSQESLARAEAGISGSMWQLKEISGEVGPFIEKAARSIKLK